MFVWCLYVWFACGGVFAVCVSKCVYSVYLGQWFVIFTCVCVCEFIFIWCVLMRAV